jgi:hypothetical protein
VEPAAAKAMAGQARPCRIHFYWQRKFTCNRTRQPGVKDGSMNAMRLSVLLKIGIWVAISACNVSFSAATPARLPSADGSVTGQNDYQTVAFSNSTEAGMLQNAYLILSTGDHDYKGHRVRAMHQIEAAAKLLGVNLSGDGKGKQPQPLSDAKLREAQGLLQSVLGASEVKSQKQVTKHLNAAVEQINIALSIR